MSKALSSYSSPYQSNYRSNLDEDEKDEYEKIRPDYTRVKKLVNIYNPHSY